MKKIIVMMTACFFGVQLYALEIELKNLSTSLAELQKSFSLQTASSGALKTVETNQKTALAAGTADLKNTLKRIIDPYRVFSSEQEREVSIIL
jgi:hypothetical protein